VKKKALTPNAILADNQEGGLYQDKGFAIGLWVEFFIYD
jgi:hypothetical protein